MKLEYVHAGTVVRLLENDQIVVAAVGPISGWRYVMQENGVMLETQDDQEVEILGVPWSPRLAMLLIKACGRE